MKKQYLKIRSLQKKKKIPRIGPEMMFLTIAYFKSFHKKNIYYLSCILDFFLINEKIILQMFLFYYSFFLLIL